LNLEKEKGSDGESEPVKQMMEVQADAPASKNGGGIGEPQPTRGSPRSESPYCWQSRKALEKIGKTFGTQATNAYAVYLALTRLSSEHQNALCIEAKIEVIASLAGLRYRKTQEILGILSDEKIIETRNPNPSGKRPNKPCTYRFVEFKRYAPSADQGKHSVPTEVCTGSDASCAVSPKEKELKVLSHKGRKKQTSPSPLLSPDGEQGGESVSDWGWGS
jgi:hypothetical protein